MFRIKDYHMHLPHLGFGTSADMRVLYAIRVVRDFVNKMSVFFLPIFLFLLGRESVEQLAFLPVSPFQRGMLVLSGYYVALGLIGFFALIPLSRVFAKIGYQRSFLFSFLLRCLFFVVIFFSKQDIRLLGLAVVIESIGQQLFWPGYYAILSKIAKPEHMGKEMGLMTLLLQLAGAVTPAISGVIVSFIGFEYIYLLATVFALLSSFLSMHLSVQKAEVTASYQEFFSWLKEAQFIKLSASFAGKYVYDALIFIWPLYLFLLLGSVERVGYLYTLSLFISLVIVYVTGNYIDNSQSKKPFYISGGLLSIITFMRSQVFSVWSIALVDVFDKLTANVYTLFFDTMFLKRSKGRFVESFFIYREMIIHFATVLFWIFFGIFFLFFDSWQGLFVLAGVGVLVGLLMKENRDNV